jgi:hypothetical protein
VGCTNSITPRVRTRGQGRRRGRAAGFEGCEPWPWVENRFLSQLSGGRSSSARSCWAIHAALGLLVQARYSTLRVPIETKNNTYSRRSQTVSTVKKSHASTVSTCSRRNERQLGPARSGAGGIPARASTFRTSVAETLIRWPARPPVRIGPAVGVSTATRLTIEFVHPTGGSVVLVDEAAELVAAGRGPRHAGASNRLTVFLGLLRNYWESVPYDMKI